MVSTPNSQVPIPNSQIPRSKISSSSVVALGIGVWVLGVFGGCSEPRAESNRGELIVAIQSAPNNLDPRIGTDEISQRVSQLVFSYLMSLDEQLRVVPVLAERLENPDPVTYIVRLRRGVSFHDGHELTSTDVVYTFTSLMAPEFISPRKGAYRLVESITALDNYSVQFKLKEPFG